MPRRRSAESNKKDVRKKQEARTFEEESSSSTEDTESSSESEQGDFIDDSNVEYHASKSFPLRNKWKFFNLRSLDEIMT